MRLSTAIGHLRSSGLRATRPGNGNPVAATPGTLSTITPIAFVITVRATAARFSLISGWVLFVTDGLYVVVPYFTGHVVAVVEAMPLSNVLIASCAIVGFDGIPRVPVVSVALEDPVFAIGTTTVIVSLAPTPALV
jgi:hypothetical protein